jgi:amino acid adenylation domain-containing protein
VKSKEIAIIGMAGRFPDARDIDAFYRNLLEGKDSIRPITEERLRETTLPPDKQYRNAGYLAGIDRFDYKFFNISLGEAQAMDPIQRLLLETVYHTIENAGYDPASFNGTRTAVFVGDASTEYYKHADQFVDTLITGNSPSFVATRITRQFNLTGNAVMVNTACSSSGLAIHFACNELMLEEAEAAIACGVNLYLFPYYDNANEMDIWSADGKSRAFSAHAAGMSNGEIVAAVMLKTLEKALEDNDPIHAVIKSTAVNNNADRSDSPYAPDSVTQAEVIKMAWEKAGVSAEDIGFVETHGSGTQLGDTLEIEGLTRAFAEYTNRKRFVPISAVKSTMGHGMSGAGIAGLVKAVLAVKKRVLFPTIHSEPANPLIDFENSAVFVNVELRDWVVGAGEKRIAGVTTLGASGTNSHMVVGEAPGFVDTVDIVDPAGGLIPVSSRTADGLKRNLKALGDWLGETEGVCLEDLAFTLAIGRGHFEYRAAFVVDSLERCVNELGLLETFQPAAVKPARLVFVFADPAEELKFWVEEFSKEFAPFSDAVAECGDCHWGFVFQYAYYRLLSALGIKNVDAGGGDLLGIGVGAIVTDVINGDLSLEEGIRDTCCYEAREIENLSSRLDAMVERETAGGPVVFVGMGPAGPVLEELLKLEAGREEPVFKCCSLEPGINALGRILALLKDLYISGFPVDWGAAYTLLPGGRRIHMPGYSFEPGRCWLREEPKLEDGADERVLFNDNEKHLEVKDHDLRCLREEGTLLEERLAGYWCEVLAIGQCSLGDDFFALGGDSLKATAVARRIKLELDVDLDFEDMFDFPRLRDLARYVDSLWSVSKRVAAAWKEVLKVEEVEAEDNFFDLGGHSLLANQVLVKVREQLRVNLDFEDFFFHPTLAAFTAFIEETLEKHAGTSSFPPITPVEEKRYYEVSSSQRRLWVLSQFEGGSVAYNTPFAFQLEGRLDVEVLRRVLGELVRRHESLRTIFVPRDGEPFQVILPPSEGDDLLEVRDLREKADPEMEIEAVIRRESAEPFYLSKGPLIRFLALRRLEDRWVFLITAHHIINDGWSMDVFFHDMIQLYNAFTAGGQSPLGPLGIQYKDYAAWQNRLLSDGLLDSQRDYWLENLAGEMPVLNVPTDFPRPASQTFEGDNVSLTIDSSVGRRLKQVCRAYDATLFMGLLAAVNVLLSRYSGQLDIVVGSPVAGRKRPEVEHVMGFFVNTLPLRVEIQPDQPFVTLLHAARETAVKGFRNEEYPFDRLVGQVNVERDLGRNPLFDVMVVLQNTNLKLDGGPKLRGLHITSYPQEERTTQVDLRFEFMERRDQIECNIGYNVRLFERGTVERMGRHLQAVVKEVSRDPMLVVKDIRLLSEGERRLLVDEWNDTAADFPRDRAIHSFLFDMAERNPGGRALVLAGEDEFVDYGTFARDVLKMGAFLRGRGAAPGDLIAVSVERSVEMMVVVYAILTIGCAYVPVDSRYPLERVRGILRDIGAGFFVFHGCGMKDLVDTVDPVDLVDGGWREFSALDRWDFAEPLDPAYVIFTSGSSGRAKGVMVEHRAVVNRVDWMQGVFPLGAGDVVLQKTTIAFDVSVWELFWWSMSGASLCLLGALDERDPGKILEAVSSCSVSVCHFVPSMLLAFLEYCLRGDSGSRLSSLRFVFSSGEELLEELVELFGEVFSGQDDARLINLYGPTEATVDVSVFDCSGDRPLGVVPIGRPIQNTRLYVLDESLELLPIGIVGQLCIGGVGLARGYLNDPGKTASAFVPHPFIEGERIYLTGDLARFLSDGNIQFLGRLDRQVKIRGFRIELGEIQACLLRHPLVLEAVVMLRRDGDPYLCAYYRGDSDIAASELRGFLGEFLPEYMIPAYFVRMEAFPLTGSGKIDRKALPLPDGSHASVVDFRAPEGALEVLVAKEWGEILSLQEPGATDYFFHVGGDSIKALKLCSRLMDHGYAVDIAAVFSHPTIESLAVFLKDQRGSVGVNQERRGQLLEHFKKLKELVVEQEENPGAIDDVYPMSDIEKGLVFYSLADPGNGIHHNQYIFQGHYSEFDLQRFTSAVKRVADCHPNLRCAFNMRDYPEPVKMVYKAIDMDIPYADLSALDPPAAEERVREVMKADLRRPFDFECAPLWRMMVFHLGEGDYAFLFCYHQSILDGWSNATLMTDVAAEYADGPEGAKRSPLAAEYRDFVLDQALESEKQEHVEFWKQELAGVEPLLFPAGAMDHLSGDTKIDRVFNFGEDLLGLANNIAGAHDTTLKHLALAVYGRLLHCAFSQDDFAVGALTHNRPVCADGDRMLGYFLNMAPVRFQFDGDCRWSEYIRDVDVRLVTIKQHDRMPLGRIARAIGVKAGKGNPIVDAMFNYTDFYITGTPESGLEENVGGPKLEIPPFAKTNTLLDFNVDVTFGDLRLTLESNVFDPETLEAFAGFFKETIWRLSANPELQLGDVFLDTGLQQASTEAPDMEFDF